MNFLAHAYLSGGDEKLLIGNFIADFVKGKSALQQFPEEIKRGIALHRSIDAFTDVHPTVTVSKTRLREKYRHYAGVIVDIFYDHFLAKNWERYHHLPLDKFASSVYSTIQANHGMLPERVNDFFPYMMRQNWLVNYSKVAGINRALTGMSRRTPYDSKMDEATHELTHFYNDFEDEFLLFFPELKNHVESFLIENTGP
jgi:acyl carrier protein phosphodiesterase